MENKEEMVEVQIPEISTSPAYNVKTIATILLVIGIIGAFCMFLVFLKTLDYVLLTSSFVSLIYIVVTWAVLNLIANISLQLKAIQDTMPLKKVVKNLSGTKDNEKITTYVTGGEKQIKNDGKIIKIGDRVTWSKTGTKYTVEDINENKVFLSTGIMGGYKWIPVEELVLH